jgi:RNA polymerase sigma-70 factor (ECF subfamily)
VYLLQLHLHELYVLECNLHLRWRRMLLTSTQLDALRTRLLDYVRSRVRTSDDAEDVVQDILVRVWQRQDTLKSEERILPWLYTIARNAVTDYWRRSGNGRTVPLNEDVDPAAESLNASFMGDAGSDPEESSAYAALSNCLVPFLEGLPEDWRLAVEMTEFQGLTQAEMGERLGLSVSGAKSRVQRARNHLKRELLSCCRIAHDSRGGILEAVCANNEPCTGDCP